MSSGQAISWPRRLDAYKRLIRLDRPIGIELLLWPTLWAVWLAHDLYPDWQQVLVFALGAALMRSAGCAINDFADRKVDGLVARTRNRPLAAGEISAKEALAVFAVLIAASASLLLFLPVQVLYWSVGALLLASLYPFTKRWIYLPQFVLGAAFSWAIPMAYVAAGQVPGWECWLLYLANLCWTVAYDTQYAMTDRDDDLQAGIKSTAILFGRHDLLIILLLQAVFLILWCLVLWQRGFDMLAVISLVTAALLFGWQWWHTRDRKPAHTFRAFLHNRWIGRWFWLLLLLQAVISY